MKLLPFVVLVVITVIDYCQCKKSDQLSSSKAENMEQKVDSKLNPVIDKLAVNLAGAFVKSIFPEIERSTKAPESTAPSVPVNVQDIRRAPAGVFDLTSSGQNGLYSSLQNPFPNIGAVPGISPAYTTGAVPYRTDLPASYVYPFGRPGQTITLPNGGQPFGLGVEGLQNLAAQPITNFATQSIVPVPDNIDAINHYRKEQYLAELQRHQQELNQYTAKQLEYLDQQRKYQQSMLDHQAGAALLMQEQQQNLLNKRMKLMSHGEPPEELQVAPEEEFVGGGIPDQQTGGGVLQNAKNKDPFRQFASRTYLETAFPENRNQEPYASDEYLRKFFKDNYNIDISEDMDGAQLTADERNTLRELKEHLIAEAKGDGLKVGALETLQKYKNKLKHLKSKANGQKVEDFPERNLLDSGRSGSCERCKPLQLQRLAGAWTQVYGNPIALRRIYSTVLSLLSVDLKSDLVTTKLTEKKASCVGFQVKKPKRKTAKMHLYFRDDTKRHELFEMNGHITNHTNSVLQVELTNLRTAFCLIKAGPEDQSKYEYVVLAENDGNDSCRSYHIFARDINRFKKFYYDVISEFMKREVVEMNILPVAGLPKPQYCQLDFRV